MQWQTPPAGLALAAEEVHVWRVALERPVQEIGRLAGLLAEDERERADRFHFQRDRRRYTVTRGALRLILGGYLGQAPAALRFAYEKHGKPFLPGVALRFNVTHSQEMALIACRTGREVGVDVEYLPRHLPDAGRLARRFFAAAEVEVFESVPESQRQEAFFNCWTRKEAYIKALGDGLTHPLDTFVVTLRPGEAARFVHIAGDTAEAAQWTLRSFRPGADYVGALATAGQGLAVCLWNFT